MSTQALLKPIQLGPMTLRNRIFMAALTRNRAVPSNVPNDLMVEHFRQRAAGGTSLIVSDGVLVSQQGSEWPNAPGIWNEEQVAAWKKVTHAVHEEGGAIFAQLWHLGRIAHPDMPEQKASGSPVYAPSAISAKGGKFRTLPGSPGYVTPTEIDDPMKLVLLFKQAAINAKEAGFDGVEIHGANGYLINQFLDNTSNLRTDSWGGSAENRVKFVLEVVKTVVEVWGADRVGIKISPCGGYNDMGMSLDETVATYKHLLSALSALKIAYIALVRYSPAFDPTGRGTIHDVVETYASSVKAPTKLFANGSYSPEEAAKQIQEGKVEGVFFGILHIGHPDLANRIKDGKALDAQLDFGTLYGHGGDEVEERKGYVDYPFAV